MSILDRYSLEGRVAVVTGAGRGIGQGIAEDFAKAGAKVILAARRTEEIKGVEQRIKEVGGTAIAITADVTKSSDLDKLGSTAINEFGKLTDWINNAGGSPLRMPAKELPREEWHKTIALNLTSIYEGCLAAERYMEKGSIINITSGAGTGPVPGSAHYGAAKAGTNSLTWTFAAEFAPNIRVNAVAPGAIPTEVMLKAIGKDETQLDSILEEWNIPLGRLGTPEDISSACIYLSSDAASWISGEILRVGGGAKPR